jgi:hypothetical protein
MWILSDLVIEDSGLGMDESTRQELLKETVCFRRRKRRYCRDGIRIAIMQIYDQEKRRKGLRANWGDKNDCIFA